MLYNEWDRQKTYRLTQNWWHHHSTDPELICPVTQQGSVTWPCVPRTHECCFQSVQSSWIKEHGKQYVSCSSGAVYNWNSLLDCLEQQCSTYPDSSHHDPGLDFQMCPHGPWPFPNNWVWLMAEGSSVTNTAWHTAISTCHRYHWFCMKWWWVRRHITSTHTPKHSQPDTPHRVTQFADIKQWISEEQSGFSNCEGWDTLPWAVCPNDASK